MGWVKPTEEMVKLQEEQAKDKEDMNSPEMKLFLAQFSGERYEVIFAKMFTMITEMQYKINWLERIHDDI